MTGPSPLVLYLCRLGALGYLGLMCILQLQGSFAWASIPLCMLSAMLTLSILERHRYDLRSSVVLLLLFCQVYFAGRPSMASEPWGWYYILGWLAYDLFLGGLLMGLERADHSSAAASRPATGSPSRAGQSRLLAVSTLMLLGYLGIVQRLLQATGADGDFLALVFTSLATRLAIAAEGLSALLQLSYVVSTFGLGCAFVLWHAYRSRVCLLAWLGAIGYGAMVLGSRGALVFPLLQLLLAASLLAKQPLRLLAMVGAPFVVAVNVFSVWYLAAREGAETTDDGYSLLDRFDAYANWLRALAEDGPVFAPGRSLVDAALQFVPRQYFPEKPYYFSTEMTRQYQRAAFDRGINLDFGGIAESFYNLGWLGPLLFGLFMAWAATHIERIRLDAMHRRSAMEAFVYAQGALLPASFFFVGWINSNLLFVALGFLVSAFVLRRLDPTRVGP